MARLDPLLHHHRNPHLRRVSYLCSIKVFGRNADYIEGMTIENDIFPNHRRIGAEPSLPAAMTDHDDRVRKWGLVLFWQKGASLSRFNAEHVEVITRDQITPDTFVVAGMTEAHGSKARDVEA